MVSDSSPGWAGRGLPPSAGSGLDPRGGSICGTGRSAGRSANSTGPGDTTGFATAGGSLDMGSMRATTLDRSAEVGKIDNLTVCLVGMPNAGKTTLMNALTGGGFHTANYPGVTVTLLKGKSKPEFGPVMNLVDLPGVHSPIAPSPEEELS